MNKYDTYHLLRRVRAGEGESIVKVRNVRAAVETLAPPSTIVKQIRRQRFVPRKYASITNLTHAKNYKVRSRKAPT